MTVEELANIVVMELGFHGFWLVSLTLICIIGIGVMGYKLYEQNRRINMLECKLDRRYFG